MPEENIKHNTVIVDASFVLAYLAPDETTENVNQLFSQHRNGQINLIAPQLLPYEVLNGLSIMVQRKRLDAKTANILAKNFLKLPIKLSKIDFKKAFTLALKEKLTVYDSSYLQLSRKLKLPLLTLDKKLDRIDKIFKPIL